MAGRKKISLQERFFEKIEMLPDSGCWLWNASTNKRGYGQFMLEGRPHLAHRVSWRIHHGILPEHLHVLHKCDTPPCVNPAHLFLGTDRDNVLDMLSKGRENRTARKFGEQHGYAKLTNDRALQIFNEPGIHAEIARKFGVSKATVTAIKSGRQWGRITGKSI